MKNILRMGAALSLVAGVAAAQNPPVAATAQPRPAGQAGQPGRQPDRAQLEKQIRDRIGTALKTNLNLSDDQFTKLQATNKRFEERRRLLVEQERDARMGMRDLMIAGDTTNQAKVSSLLDRMMLVQRQRFELVEQEQKELAGYLTPLQRAKYLGMQEQMFRRVEALRQQGQGRGQPRAGRPMGPGMGQGMGPGMAPGMAPGMGQGMGPGMAPGTGQGMKQVRPPNAPPAGTVPPDGDVIP